MHHYSRFLSFSPIAGKLYFSLFALSLHSAVFAQPVAVIVFGGGDGDAADGLTENSVSLNACDGKTVPEKER